MTHSLDDQADGTGGYWNRKYRGKRRCVKWVWLGTPWVRNGPLGRKVYTTSLEYMYAGLDLGDIYLGVSNRGGTQTQEKKDQITFQGF